MRVNLSSLRFCLVFLTLCIALRGHSSLVQVTADGDDNVGERLVTRVRERLVKSARFELTNDDNADRMIVVIKTMSLGLPAPCDDEGHATIYSVVWYLNVQHHHLYLDSTVGGAGVKSLDEAADAIVARADHLFQIVADAAAKATPKK